MRNFKFLLLFKIFIKNVFQKCSYNDIYFLKLFKAGVPEFISRGFLDDASTIFFQIPSYNHLKLGSINLSDEFELTKKY